MKKIYAIAALFLAASTSYGQRQFDLELKMITPLDGATVPQTSSQTVTFTLQHEGAALVEGDTINIYYANYTTQVVYALDGTPNAYNYFVLDAAQASNFSNSLQPVPSATFNQGSPITINTLSSGYSVGDEIVFFAEIAPVTAGTDTNMVNNIGSFTLDAPNSINKLNAIELKAFPNPATTELSVISKEEVASISIMNLDGKVIFTNSGNKIDVSILTSGVYLYEATTISGLKAVNKFVKQ